MNGRFSTVALLSIPGIAVLGALAALGAIRPSAAVLGAVAVLGGTALAVRPLLGGLEQLRSAIDTMADDDDAAPAFRSASGPVDALWLSVTRLTRLWRQKRREREASLAAVQAVMQALPQPLILIDAARRIVRANPAATQLFGEVAGRDLGAALRHPALLAAADAVLRGEGGRSIDALLGERHYRARIERLERPAADGTVAVLTLGDRTDVMRTEKMRADFVANASHELRTPLASLIGFIETLQGPALGDAAAHERFLAIMRDQAGRMTQLVDDLLSLSRIEMNEHRPPTGTIALAPVLRAVADALAIRAKARDMTIVLDVAADLPDVVGDAEELQQLFQNLVDNAVKYGDAGTPITVTARLGERGGPMVAVSVRDEGEGIAREHIPRLTERFYRVDAARSRAVGGTGLGLAIVKHIVGRHRGILDIASELGSGSTFTVFLRASAGAPRPSSN